MVSSLPDGVAGALAAARALRPALARHLPRELCEGVEPVRLVRGELLLACSDGARAAKLRMLVQGLLRQLRSEGVPVDSVVLHVDASAARPALVAPKHGDIPEGALRKLGVLAARLESGPLKDALRALLQRRARD